MDNEYPPIVAQLITLGETQIDTEMDYLSLGLTREHIPALLRLVQDEVLRTLPWDEDSNVPPGVYAQVHAWRALTQLNAQEAIPVFLDLLYLIDDEDDDFVSEEIPIMLGRLGAAAIEPCLAYLQNGSHGLYARVAAAYALAQIGRQHPEERDACIKVLAAALKTWEDNDETLNGFLVSYLIDLQAVEHLDLIRSAFEADKVDEFIVGDFEDVQIALGLLEKRLTPRRQMFPYPVVDFSEHGGKRQAAARKREKKKKKKARRIQARKTRRQTLKRKQKKKRKR
ncbi:MAG: hypothetical protein Kow0063_11060 [Anaerolineae bacterium]